MKCIIGKDRNQATIFPVSLDEAINQNNEVRVIDLFVDSLDIEKMEFRINFGEELFIDFSFFQ